MPLISLKSIEITGILYFSVIDFQEAHVFIYRFFIVDIATCSLVIFLYRISADQVCFKHNNFTMSRFSEAPNYTFFGYKHRHNLVHLLTTNINIKTNLRLKYN